MTTEDELLCSADPIEQDSPQRAWCLLRQPFGYVARGANHMVLCGGLKPATGCVGLGAS